MTNEEFKIAKALFELSGLQVSDILSEANFEAFKAQLEATSNSITDDMFEYWTTNQNLEIRFDIEHATNDVRYLNIRIYNSKHRVTTFISLMRSNELSTVCLLDTFTDQGAEVRLKRMVGQKIIADKKILYYHSIIGQNFADIEDLFSKEEYLALYNGAFGTSIQIENLDVNKPTISLLCKSPIKE